MNFHQMNNYNPLYSQIQNQGPQRKKQRNYDKFSQNYQSTSISQTTNNVYMNQQVPVFQGGQYIQPGYGYFMVPTALQQKPKHPSKKKLYQQNQNSLMMYQVAPQNQQQMQMNLQYSALNSQNVYHQENFQNKIRQPIPIHQNAQKNEEQQAFQNNKWNQVKQDNHTLNCIIHSRPSFTPDYDNPPVGPFNIVGRGNLPSVNFVYD